MQNWWESSAGVFIEHWQTPILNMNSTRVTSKLLNKSSFEAAETSEMFVTGWKIVPSNVPCWFADHFSWRDSCLFQVIHCLPVRATLLSACHRLLLWCVHSTAYIYVCQLHVRTSCDPRCVCFCHQLHLKLAYWIVKCSIMAERFTVWCATIGVRL